MVCHEDIVDMAHTPVIEENSVGNARRFTLEIPTKHNIIEGT